MKVYPDTNFLVRFYLKLPESESVLERLPRIDTPLTVTWLTEMETINAIERYVFETAKGAGFRVNAEVAAAAQADFRSDRESGSFLQFPILPLDRLRKTFEELAFRHTARHGFRTYDLLHVSAAITLGCEGFWSFDNKALHLARLEGLITE